MQQDILSDAEFRPPSFKDHETVEITRPGPKTIHELLEAEFIPPAITDEVRVELHKYNKPDE